MSKYVTLAGLSEFLNKSKTIFAQKGDLAVVATTGNYTDLINKPTIPVVDTDLSADSLNPIANNAVTNALAGKADKATTLAGYGIADATISGGVITLGNETITPLTEHQSLAEYAKREELTPYAKKEELATVATTGSYNDLEDKPYIPDDYVLPTATGSVLGGVKIGSGLSITSGVVAVVSAPLATKALQDGEGNVIVDTYALKSDVAAFAKALKYKGSVETYDALPPDAAIGDVWNVQTADKTHGVKAGENVVWNGTDWDNLGGTCDMSEYTKTEDLAKVATSGSYNDLADKPYIPEDYELPVATATTLGGIKIGSDITINANGVASVAHATDADGANFANCDSTGRMITLTYATISDVNFMVKSVTASDDVITVTQKNGTSTTLTINNVAHATNADTAGKATSDASGNNIETTYAKAADIAEATTEEIDALFE